MIEKKIKNIKSLAVSELRKDALSIIESGLESIDTKDVIRSSVELSGNKLKIKTHTISLDKVKRIFIVGIGKCALQASSVLVDVLKDKLTRGIVLDVSDGSLKKIKVFKGDHPLPSNRNMNATKEIIELLDGLNKDDLVLFIISGGGSSLLCQPQDFTCKQEADILDCLFTAGANIIDMNTVRKHISLARGGNLAKHAYPAQIVSLIFSDIPGDNLEFVASGPTINDTTTKKDAENILKKYKVKDKCRFNVGLLETPKDVKYFKNVTNILLVSNTVALNAMHKKAKELKYKVNIQTSFLRGEAREVSLDILNDIRSSTINTVLLYGGETTVTLHGRGKGGRNQELSLAALSEIKDGELISSIASDGRDNGEAAGALCDIITKEKVKKLKLNIKEYLDINNAGELFDKTESVVMTGHTGSNVSDLIIAIKK